MDENKNFEVNDVVETEVYDLTETQDTKSGCSAGPVVALVVASAAVGTVVYNKVLKPVGKKVIDGVKNGIQKRKAKKQIVDAEVVEEVETEQ